MPLAHEAIPVHGREGIVTAVIDGNVVELAEIKTLSATIDFNKTEYFVLGDRAARHKTAGWTGTGSVTYHWVSPRFVKMIIEGAKSGKIPYFTMTVTNNDPGTSATEFGTKGQTIKLGQVSIDGGDIIHVDIENELLEGSFDFTFSEVDGIDYFKDLEE